VGSPRCISKVLRKKIKTQPVEEILLHCFHFEIIFRLDVVSWDNAVRTGCVGVIRFSHEDPRVEDIKCHHGVRDHCAIEYVCTVANYDSMQLVAGFVEDHVLKNHCVEMTLPFHPSANSTVRYIVLQAVSHGLKARRIDSVPYEDEDCRGKHSVQHALQAYVYCSAKSFA
jgi:hypothetical protein